MVHLGDESMLTVLPEQILAGVIKFANDLLLALGFKNLARSHLHDTIRNILKQHRNIKEVQAALGSFLSSRLTLSCWGFQLRLALSSSMPDELLQSRSLPVLLISSMAPVYRELC